MVVLVVGVQAVLGRAHDAAAVLLPVVDRHRVCRDLALENRVFLQLLADANRPETDLRSNCKSQQFGYRGNTQLGVELLFAMLLGIVLRLLSTASGGERITF